MQVSLCRSLSDIDPAAWNALVGDHDPFVEHAFLSALETSGSVGPGTGWHPVHVIVTDGDILVGALPLYEKHHSYGEYIFDFAWANASSRLGARYYPKLVSMVPVTPVTGRRLLIHPDADADAIAKALLDGCDEAMRETGASSLHLLFLTESERDQLLRVDPGGDMGGLLSRTTEQFHWHNDGYADFDDYLSRFRSSMRKKAKKERRGVAEAGIEVRIRRGDELSPEDFQALNLFYRITCARYGSEPYLADAFFSNAEITPKTRALGVFAYKGEEIVGGSLNFEKGDALYGRYWGCTEENEYLHFELCYYQLIEYAISRGLQRFEAGAQGMHKLRRGLMPQPIYSLHRLKHPILASAVADFLPREAEAVLARMDELRNHGPFKRGA